MATNVNASNAWGTYHISSNTGDTYEVARNNFFALEIDSLDDLVYPQFNQYITDQPDSHFITSSANSGQAIIALSVKTMFAPHYKTNPIEIRRGNSVVKFADVPSWDSGTITTQDFVGLRTKDVLLAWQALVYDVNTDYQGRAYDWVDEEGRTHRGYKRDCWLTEYTPNHEVIRRWRLVGCWLSGITEGKFDVEGSGGREIECQFEYDRAYVSMPDTFFSTEE